MVRATTDEIGRALYQILKGQEVQNQEEFDPATVARRTVTNRITRKLPNGAIEIIEETITDEIAY